MNRRSFMQMLGITPALPLVIGFSTKPSEPTILELVDSGALGVPKLFRVQRFVLKMVYGLELDDQDRQYLARLERRGRYTPAREGSQETALIMGRRSGMTWLGQTIQLYETLRLLRTPELVQGNVLTVACDKDQANLNRNTYAAFLEESHLSPYVSSNTGSGVRFHTEDEGYARALFKSAQAKTLRGFRTSSVVLDNAAFYQDLSQTYSIVAPLGGRVSVLTSSDGSKSFRAFYHEARQRGALTLQIPSWDANPIIPSAYYSRERDRLGLRRFGLEYGAKV